MPTVLPSCGSNQSVRSPFATRCNSADLLVTLESTPRIDPAIPWATETGSPRIEGQEIVLELDPVTEDRHYRLRRLE